MEDENLKIPKSFKIYLIILLVAGIVFINPSSREKIFDTLNLFSASEKELQLVNEFNIDKGFEKIDISKDKVIKWNDNKLSFLDFNGFEVLKKDFKFEDPDVYFGESTIYVMDKASGNLYLLNKAGETIKRLELKSPFLKLKEDGDKLYIYKKDGDKESVDIINKDGELLKTHEEKIPLLAVAMGNKDKEYLISTLDIHKDLKTMVNIYSIDGADIGSIEIKDELVIYSEFIRDRVVIATEKKVYLLEDGKIKWDKEIEGLKDIKLVNKDIYLLYKNKFEILNLKGRAKEEIVLKEDLEDIRFIEDSIVLFGKKNIVIPGKKKNILNFKTKEDILDLKYDENNLLIQKEGKVEIYNIIEKGKNNE